MVVNEEYEYELSIVMPCLNEVETVGLCVDKAMSFIEKNKVNAEIVVADNGSSDGSLEVIRQKAVRLINVEEKGYGAALMGGINAAKGKYIIMGDTDGSHDLENLMPFLEKLREGYELVVGNRFKGGIEKKAMSFANRYIGNPVLSGLGRIFFKSKVKDFHCGLRGFTKRAYNLMNLRTSGMEFASEMIVKATLRNLNIIEIPVVMLPSGRPGPAHLKPFRDGWRHLRFLLLFSPRWLFLYPSIFMIVAGVSINLWVLPGSQLNLDVHTMLYAAALIIIGMQGVSFAVLTKVFAVQEELLPEHPRLNRLLKYATLEKGIFIGMIIFICGMAGVIFSLVLLERGWFKDLSISNTMRIVITSATLLIVSFQIFFSSFFYSILKLKFHKSSNK
ncbi:glycosyltransferase family 2 protein [Bacteroidetes/Chlorobi group bacterium ChocPot_Mid]|nr:MAG: glycosyltransferase family 2 protein [Bacteroidetes/Chlorobi group bacterium ChocPot_Mid]